MAVSKLNNFYCLSKLLYLVGLYASLASATWLVLGKCITNILTVIFEYNMSPVNINVSTAINILKFIFAHDFSLIEKTACSSYSFIQDTVEMFLSHSAGVRDEADIEGRTALMWAAGKGADDVIRAFIKYKADVNQTDKNGGTGKRN